MRWNSFARSLAFALVSAAAILPWLALARPFLTPATALTTYFVTLTALYLAGLAPEPHRRAPTLGAALLAGTLVAFFTRSPNELALGLAILLGIGRSAFLYPSLPARAVVLESFLLTAGLLFARHFAGPTPGKIAMAVWAFFLVQSLFFLVSGMHVRRGSHRDPFEEAHRRALALLD